MLQITINVNAPASMAEPIKESLAMYLERWGDCRVAEIRSLTPKEMAAQLQRQQQGR